MLTVTDAISHVNNQFGFSVDKFPLAGPDGLKTPLYGLFRSDTSALVGKSSVTARYVPHTTDDVLALVEAGAKAFDDSINVKCYFSEGHYVVLEPTKEQRRDIAHNDGVFPRILIRAAYDGKAFKATLGFYRDLCKNLAIMRQVSGTSVSIRHTSNLRPQMDDLIGQFEYLRNGWDKFFAVMQSLQAQQVQMVDFLNEIYGEPDAGSKRGVTVHKNRTEAIFKRLQRELTATGQTIGSDWQVPAWLAYNAVQGYVQHDATRKESDEFGRAILATNDMAVRKAENIVMSLVA